MNGLLQTILGGVGAGLTYVASTPTTDGTPKDGGGIPVKHTLDMESLMPIGIVAVVLIFLMRKK